MATSLGRTEITAAVVEQADVLFRRGLKPAAVARQIGTTRYVAWLLYAHRRLPPRRGKPRPHARPADGDQVRVDAAAVRRVQRMLAVGILPVSVIAREADVSRETVAKIECGQRLPLSAQSPPREAFETFLPAAIRCRGCGGPVEIIPCRLCMARLLRRVLGIANVRTILRRRRMSRFTAGQIFGQWMAKINSTYGVTQMPDLLPLVADEISTFLGAADRREFVIRRAEALFDTWVLPIDLPGPDAVFDPLLRAAIRPLVGRVYDRVHARLAEQTHA